SRAKLDMQNPYNSNLFQSLTVFDPTNDYDRSGDPINNDGDGEANENWTDFDKTPELKIPGRININTAPWFVIAQLPWMTDEKAKAIVAYRDKLNSPVNYDGQNGRYDAIEDLIDSSFDGDDIREDPGFASIGELNFIISDSNGEDYRIDQYALDNEDLIGFPDLTPEPTGTGSFTDDFEERDVIFSRISNLATVRSDVFTAYILVRVGVDGPQKRVIAILDRSNVYPNDSEVVGKVKILALHPVADPR
ncbi:MAG: ComEA family DNA-binding protein, partial [Planctomycetota bacterium]